MNQVVCEPFGQGDERAARHADFVARYAVPVVNPDAPFPELRWPRRREAKLRSLIGATRARMRGPRLAYLDSHFPWKRSGFRYADALALLEARPDTMFFSMYETGDTFPAPVHPLADFPIIAPTCGVTDAYGVFLNFTGGLLGLWDQEAGRPGPTDGLDISPVLRRERIRLHAALHPGGGFTATEQGIERARRLVHAADQVLSWVPQVIEQVPGVVAIDPAAIDTHYFSYRERDFTLRPIVMLFAADALPRKGLDTALAAMRLLTNEDVHLNVVGPHQPPTGWARSERVTFHGWLEPADLRRLHHSSHVFLSPVRVERSDSDDNGITDGFPTAAAGEAMSSGCLLVSSNPDRDRRALRPGVDHIEPDATAESFATSIRGILADPGTAAAMAATGAARVRQRLDVRVGVAQRLTCMGLY